MSLSKNFLYVTRFIVSMIPSYMEERKIESGLIGFRVKLARLVDGYSGLVWSGSIFYSFACVSRERFISLVTLLPQQRYDQLFLLSILQVVTKILCILVTSTVARLCIYSVACVCCATVFGQILRSQPLNTEKKELVITLLR